MKVKKILVLALRELCKDLGIVKCFNQKIQKSEPDHFPTKLIKNLPTGITFVGRKVKDESDKKDEIKAQSKFLSVRQDSIKL